MQNMILGTSTLIRSQTHQESPRRWSMKAASMGSARLKARSLSFLSLPRDRQTDTHTNCRDTTLQSLYRTNRRVNCTWNGCPLLDSLILDQAIRKAFLFCEYDQGSICLARCNPRKVRRIDSDVCIRTQNMERREVWVLRMI